MSTNKKKRNKATLNDTKSFRQQRSSLQVNLSCVSSLTNSVNSSNNSVNGSIKQVDINFDTNSKTSYDIPLKNVRIVLQKINKNNVMLNRNSESLFVKETDLVKNNQEDLSIKTGQILDIRSNDSNELIKEDTQCANAKSELLFTVSDVTSKIKYKSNTPKGRCKNKNVNKVNQQVGLRKKLLNLQKPLNGMIGNNTNLENDTLKQRLTQVESKNHNNSKVLTETNKILCNYNEKNNHSESTFITEPIGYSTIIKNKLLNIEEGIYFKNINSLSLEPNIIENAAIEHSSLQKILKNNHKSDYLIVQGENIDSAHYSSYDNFKVIENDKDINLSESGNTLQISLNVNTSTDQINISNKHKNKYEWKNLTLDNTEQKNVHFVDLNVTQESTNTICTSLQMNTSLDISNKLQENSNEDLQTSEFIKDSADRSETTKDQNVKYAIATRERKKCKRKLLPLCECSQLISISPVEQEYSSSKCLIFRKKHKRRKSRYNKIVNINNTECVKGNSTQDYNKKKEKKPKKVISKKIIFKETVNEDILRKLKKNKGNYNELKTTNIYAPERNSSDDFQPLKKSSIVQITNKKQTQKLNIVTTGLSNEDKDIVKSVVKALGFAKIKSHVTKNTTHVVTTGVRTINLLHGIIRGCWLVSLEWVLKSLESNTWLNPEKYEMVHFSKAVLENRKDRQLFGKAYIPELFAACGYIYVEKNTTPPYNLLKDLIKAAGGSITENPEIAKILIGTEGLKETWILDCITSGELQPYNQYQHQCL